MSEERRPEIYQANPLVEGRQPFSAIEMRLFLLALQHVNPHLSANDKFYDEEFRELHLTPAQTKEIFGHGEYLARLEKICDEMMGKFVTVKNGNGDFSKRSIFGRIEYKQKEGLYILLDEQMKPLVLDLFESETGYTKIAAKHLFNLSSAYAVRLVELMLQYRGMAKSNIITRHFELDDLRMKMDIKPDEYQRISDFKKRILNDPIKDIEEYTPYKISYTVTKTGRKVTGVDVIMDCSEVIQESEVAPNIKLEALPKVTDRHGLSEKAVTELTIICGSNEEFKKRMDYAIKIARERKVKNLQGFLYNAVKDNYLQQELDVQAAIKKEMQAMQENHEWEQVATKMFSNEIEVDNSRPEVQFDMNNAMEAAVVRIIKRELKQRNLSFTSRSRLEEHNMSVGRFVELYAD